LRNNQIGTPASHLNLKDIQFKALKINFLTSRIG